MDGQTIFQAQDLTHRPYSSLRCHIGVSACTEIDHTKDLLCLKNGLAIYTQTLLSNVVISQVPSCHANALLEDLPFVQRQITLAHSHMVNYIVILILANFHAITKIIFTKIILTFA